MILTAVPVWAADDLKAEFGGFIDTYYAYDFNRPPNIDRAFTTQPARHNEFNLNLAFLEAKVSANDVRGRLAVQTGTSVQANYAGEPNIGAFSGPTLSRHIQEAVAGYQLATDLWVDAGIYLSHLGFESFISRDNWTYTRSLAADYSPYYQSGVRLSYQFSRKLSSQLHLVNGWQNISESNPQKAVGAQLSYSLNNVLTLTYNNLVGYEAGSRIFNDFIVKIAPSEKLQFAGVFDLGFQRPRGSEAYRNWSVATFLSRYQVTPKLALAGRVERFFDRHQIIVSTNSPGGFNTWGASIGTDVALRSQLVWRTELRKFWSRDEIFPKRGSGRSERNAFVVASLSLSI